MDGEAALLLCVWASFPVDDKKKGRREEEGKEKTRCKESSSSWNRFETKYGERKRENSNWFAIGSQVKMREMMKETKEGKK